MKASQRAEIDLIKDKTVIEKWEERRDIGGGNCDDHKLILASSALVLTCTYIIVSTINST